MNDKPKSETAHSYYRDKLTTWRSDLAKQRRQLMSRYAAMERTDDPNKRDQRFLLEINEGMLELVTSALIGLAGRERREALQRV